MTCKDCDLNYYPCEGEKTIKQLEAENRRLMNEVADYSDECYELISQNKQLEAEVKKLRFIGNVLIRVIELADCLDDEDDKEQLMEAKEALE